jgi:hypothetical protein
MGEFSFGCSVATVMSGPVGSRRPSGLGLTTPLLLVVVAALLPVWSGSIPPLMDYHNHLARQYILTRIDTSEFLSQWYTTAWHATPYLAFDVIVQVLSRFMSVDIAGKVFLSLMLVLLGLAPVALSLAAYGRVTPVALLGLLFVHNETVNLGFVNYVFGVGFALCVAAMWIRLRHGPHWTRLLLFPLLCSLVFFSHLLGFIIYALIVCSYELGKYIDGVCLRSDAKRWQLDRQQRVIVLSLFLQCALPLGIFAAFGISTETISINTYGGLERKLGLLFGMFGYLMPPHLWTVDRFLLMALPVALLALLVTRRLCIDPAMAWPLGTMLLVYFALPMQMFSGWGADSRFRLVLGLLLVASLRPVKVADWHARPWIPALIVLLVVVRIGSVTSDWRKADEKYAEYMQAFRPVIDGSRVFFAFGHAGDKQIGTWPVYHLPLLILARHDVYVPHLFATASWGYTLQYRPEVERLQALSRGPVLLRGASPDWGAIQDRFDFFVLIDERHFDSPVPASFSPVFEGPSVRVYRHLSARAPS